MTYTNIDAAKLLFKYVLDESSPLESPETRGIPNHYIIEMHKNEIDYIHILKDFVYPRVEMLLDGCLAEVNRLDIVELSLSGWEFKTVDNNGMPTGWREILKNDVPYLRLMMIFTQHLYPAEAKQCETEKWDDFYDRPWYAQYISDTILNQTVRGMSAFLMKHPLHRKMMKIFPADVAGFWVKFATSLVGLVDVLYYAPVVPLAEDNINPKLGDPAEIWLGFMDAFFTLLTEAEELTAHQID